MLTLNKDSVRSKFTDLFADKRRVLARSFLIGIDLPTGWLDAALAADPGQLLNHAVSFQRAANLLPRGDRALTPEERSLLGRSTRSVHAEWLNVTATGMQGLPALQQAVGFTAAQIFEPIDRDNTLRILLSDASSAKDMAMDLRDLSATYGWMQACVVMDWLRDNIPILPPNEAQAILDDFKPLFVLIAQVQDQRASRAASLQAARAAASAETEVATDQARKSQLWTSFQAGQPLSNADLMELALSVAEETAAPKVKDPTPDKDERKAPRARQKK